MKWIIKCPVTPAPQQREREEHRFATSIRNLLVRHGHSVVIQYLHEWSGGEDAADVVLVLRGSHRYLIRNPKAVHVVWNLNSGSVVAEEIEDCDIFAVASEPMARQLGKLHGDQRIVYLPPCVDTEVFNLSAALPARERRGFIFLGNGGKEEPWGVLDWLRQGFPLRIWGRDWRCWPETLPFVEADGVAGDRRSRLYGSARVIFHDQAEERRAQGFVDTGIYEALACGLPVITQHHPALEGKFGEAVIGCDAETPMQRVMERVLHDYPGIFEGAQREAARICEQASFEARVEELKRAVESVRRLRSGHSLTTGFRSDVVLSAEPRPRGYGDAGEDDSIVIVDVDRVGSMAYQDAAGVAVVMPSIDLGKALRTARLLVKRAGMPTRIFVVNDNLRQGFIRTLNSIAARLDVRYVVYLAEDAFPGLEWLASAYARIEETGVGLLAFNCGKWRGRVAAFGMVRTTWVYGLYGDAILFPGYRAHKADNELTVLARVTGQYVYEPDSVLVEIDAKKVFKENVPEDKTLFRKRFRNGFDGLVRVEDLRPLAEAYFVPMEDGAAPVPAVLPTSPDPRNEAVHGIASFFHRQMDPGIRASLQAEYIEKGLEQEKDTFVLYRIIGNDLYPRHRKGQSRENLRFILSHETEFDGCEKRFVLNRIIDPDEERAIVELLEGHGAKYLRIPFDPEQYRRVGFDLDVVDPPELLSGPALEKMGPVKAQRLQLALYRHKNNYVMNNNGARNVALEDGRQRAKWILPFDGNCFLTPDAWQRLRTDVIASPHLKYFVAPMARVTSNDELLSGSVVPDPVEEPQLIFRKDATEMFDEAFCYGRRPKVEFFWRLSVAGKWDAYKDDAWDRERPPLSRDAGQFGVAGWVARLFSGMPQLETQDLQGADRRYHARAEAILATLRALDRSMAGVSATTPGSVRLALLEREGRLAQGGGCPFSSTLDRLKTSADEALGRGLQSVVDKTTLPPSGDRQDYWHPAPYWWPNPRTPDGLPYVRKDGERVPGSQLYEPGSERYDRTRLQRVFDDSFTLSLAWALTGEQRYAGHGVQLLERFFVDPETRMNPHLRFGQVRMGHNGSVGAPAGIIEMKDMYFYLDAVRLFERAGAMRENILVGFRNWLGSYLDWLLNSSQGHAERAATNNHGTCYDLQVAAIASFLDEGDVVYDAMTRAQSRIGHQFAPNGSQPEELARKTTAHYCCFNFQSWINLAELASRWGVDLWSYENHNGAGLKAGARWLTSHLSKAWPYEQIDAFDKERFYPIWFAAAEHVDDLSGNPEVPTSVYLCKPLYHPHDGIRPFWNIGSYASSHGAWD